MQKFFGLTNLRKLTLSENDLVRIPPNIANLTKLAELDISKNGNLNESYCTSRIKYHFISIKCTVPKVQKMYTVPNNCRLKIC